MRWIAGRPTLPDDSNNSRVAADVPGGHDALDAAHAHDAFALVDARPAARPAPRSAGAPRSHDALVAAGAHTRRDGGHGAVHRKPTARHRPRVRPAPQVPGRVVACAFFTAFTMLLAGTFAPLAADTAFTPSSAVQESASYTLGTYTAMSQSTDSARISNMAIAARDLDGTQIAPGRTISLNELLGNTGDDRRYSEAPAYNGEGTVAERGGGVCQVSSAVYVAALQAGLSIVERHAHSVAVDYVPVGLDATLSYGTYDLQIRNDYAHTVVLHVQSDGQTVAASVLSADPEASAELERKATSEVTGRYKGYADGATRADYYDVTAYLVTYRAGQKEAKQEISSDTYEILSGSNTQAATE